MTEPNAADGFYVTALGTGASALDNERASVGYLVHVDGEPTILVDAGGGVAARLSDARVDLTTLEAVFFSHLHVDHTAALPAIVKAAYQQGRGDRPLSVYGPAGNAVQPGTEAWRSRLFDEESGAYGYLSEFLERYVDGELSLPVTEIDAEAGADDDPVRVYNREGVVVDAIPVVHGRVPTLAYRVSDSGRSVTFSGDYAAETGNVARIADGTDVLVHHRVLPDDATGPKTGLHPTASDCGSTAHESGTRALCLSHIGRDDPTDLEGALETVREAYGGRIVVLRDLLDVFPDGTVRETREHVRTPSRSSDAIAGSSNNPSVVVIEEGDDVDDVIPN